MSSTTTPDSKPGHNGRRQSLLDATMEVIAEQGFRGFTHRAVAVKAGVTHGLVRHYFGSLDVMLAEALATSVERDIADAPPDRSWSVDELARNLPNRVADTEGQQTFQYLASLESRRRPELREEVERIYELYITAMQERLRRAGLPDDRGLARVVFATLDGLVFQQLTVSQPEDTVTALAWLRRMLAALCDEVTT